MELLHKLNITYIIFIILAILFSLYSKFTSGFIAAWTHHVTQIEKAVFNAAICYNSVLLVSLCALILYWITRISFCLSITTIIISCLFILAEIFVYGAPPIARPIISYTLICGGMLGLGILGVGVAVKLT